jgi:hypothetical protein
MLTWAIAYMYSHNKENSDLPFVAVLTGIGDTLIMLYTLDIISKIFRGC